MAYINTTYGVGDLVYAYDADTDSVQRLRVISVSVTSRDASSYGTGNWAVSYLTAPTTATPFTLAQPFNQDELHSTSRGAFPEIVEVMPAPLPTLDEVTA